jgi:hypothetical protein
VFRFAVRLLVQTQGDKIQVPKDGKDIAAHEGGCLCSCSACFALTDEKPVAVEWGHGHAGTTPALMGTVHWRATVTIVFSGISLLVSIATLTVALQAS